MKFTLLRIIFRKILPEKKAVATIYSSLLALILVISLLILVTSYYLTYSGIIQSQTALSNERFQEKISITNTYISGQSLKVVVENVGSIESTVKAVYVKNDGKTTFVNDPSVVIEPSATAEIPIPLPTVSNYSIVVSTERGTLSTEYFLPSWAKNNYLYDTENLTIGALRLRFESFEISTYTSGTWGPWTNGWTPPINVDLRWRVNITNISEFPIITVDNRTSLSLSACDGPNEIAWYIEPFPINLNANQSKSIIFQVDRPDGSSRAKIESSFKDQPSMVFLTFFGTSTDINGKKTAYGQNIPFEAIIPQ